MDIFKYAKEINYAADYYDFYTGNTYLIQNYGKALKNGLPTNGIEVIDSCGNSIGFAQPKE